MRYRLAFMLISALIVVIVLSITHRAAEQQRAYEAEQERLLRHVETILEALFGEQEERERLEQENEELRVQFQLRQDTQSVVASNYLSRSGRQIDAVWQVSGYTAEELERAFAYLGWTGMAGTGAAMIASEAEYEVNAVVQAAISVHESAAGTSYIARTKNNLVAIGAYDYDPVGCAWEFDERGDSILALGKLLRTHYAEGGKHHGGEGIAGIGVKYATDPYWAEKVERIAARVLDAMEITRVVA